MRYQTALRSEARSRRSRFPFGGGAVAVRGVRLRTRPKKDEGLRIGTVRRPPRGVPKAELAVGQLVQQLVPRPWPRRGPVALGGGGLTRSGPPSARNMAWKCPPDDAADVPRCAHSADFSVSCTAKQMAGPPFLSGNCSAIAARRSRKGPVSRGCGRRDGCRVKRGMTSASGARCSSTDWALVRSGRRDAAILAGSGSRVASGSCGKFLDVRIAGRPLLQALNSAWLVGLPPLRSWGIPAHTPTCLENVSKAASAQSPHQHAHARVHLLAHIAVLHICNTVTWSMPCAWTRSPFFKPPFHPDPGSLISSPPWSAKSPFVRPPCHCWSKLAAFDDTLGFEQVQRTGEPELMNPSPLAIGSPAGLAQDGPIATVSGLASSLPARA